VQRLEWIEAGKSDAAIFNQGADIRYIISVVQFHFGDCELAVVDAMGRELLRFYESLLLLSRAVSAWWLSR
jgi:hypothetical protein